MTIENTTINNSADAAQDTGHLDVLAGSHINLDNATILQGFISIVAGGEMLTVGGTSNAIETSYGQDDLSAITISNAGILSVSDDSSLTLASPDAIDNSGTIALNSTGNATHLYFDQPDAAINGGGQIILSANINNVIAVTQSGDHLTDFDNTISGAGTIGANGMVLINDAVINADQQSAALTLDPAFLANTGTLEATKDATLVFSNTTVSNSSVTTKVGGSYSFNNSIDDPAAVSITAPSGINDAGQIVGTYFSGGKSNGFLHDGSDYITLDDPAATGGTSANAINDSGEIVGTYSAGGTQSGFLFSNGTYVTLNDPLGADGTLANGIDNAGQIVGEYLDAHGSIHGFLFSSGTYTTIDDPLGINDTDAKGINDAGEIVGYYLDGSSLAHGFVYNNGTYVTLNDPSAANGTFAEGINDAGQVVGYYLNSSDVAHGFVYSNGTYFNFDDSAGGTGAGEGTFAFAIDNAGMVSGYYVGGGFDVAGFLAKPAQSPTSGSIFADSGATVDLVGTSIVGGNLTTAAATNTSAAGLIDVTGNAISAIYDATVNNSGALSIEQGSQLDVSGTTFTSGSLGVAGILDSIGTGSIGSEAITVTGVLEATGDTLTIDSGSSIANYNELLATSDGTIVLVGVTVTNAGTVQVDDPDAGQSAKMVLEGATISGGTVNIYGSLDSTGTSFITNAAITNTGKVDATAGILTISDPVSFSNTGTVEASNGATLLIDPVTVSDTGGMISAQGAGSAVKLLDATIAGGTLATGSLTSDSSGNIEIAAAGGVDTSVFDGSAGPLTIDGYVRVDAGANLELIGTIDNQGTIEINSTITLSGPPAPAYLVIERAVTLDGHGRIALDDYTDGIVAASTGGTLANVNNTIWGAGSIGWSDDPLTFVNKANGVVDATGSMLLEAGKTPITNTGLLEATQQGSLEIIAEVDNAGGTIAAHASEYVAPPPSEQVGIAFPEAWVTLVDATIRGGTLVTDNPTSDVGGVIEVIATDVIDGSVSPVAMNAYIQVDDGANLELLGTIDNTGTIALSAGGADPGLVIEGQVSLQGTGGIILSGLGDNIIGATWNDGCNVLINYNDISGAGQIGECSSDLTLINTSRGVIDANVANGTLTLDTGCNIIVNVGLLEASNGSTIAIYSDICNSGTLEANGATLLIKDGLTNTGTIDVQSGTVDVADGGTNTGARYEGSGVLVFGGMQIINDVTLTGEGGTLTIDNFGALDFVTAASAVNFASLTNEHNSDSLQIENTRVTFDDTTASGGTIVETGPNAQINVDAGNSATFENTTLTLSNNAADNGAVLVDGTITIDSTVNIAGTGTFTIANGGNLEFGGSVPNTETLAFIGSTGTLQLDDPQAFSGQISGFTGTAPNAAHSDVIDLAGINYNSGDFSDTYNPATGVLSVTDGTKSALLTFVGFTGTFQFASDSNGGTDVFDPPTASPTVADGGRLAVRGHLSETVTFAGDTGTLVIKHPLTFDGQIAGISGSGDVVDLKHFNVTYTTEMSSFNSASDTTVLTATNSANRYSLTLTLNGNYSNFAFNIASDGHHHGIDITGTPDASQSGGGGSITSTTSGAITNVGSLPASELTSFDDGGVVFTSATSLGQIAPPEITPNTPVFDDGGVVFTIATTSSQIAPPEISPNTAVEVPILPGSTTEVTASLAQITTTSAAIVYFYSDTGSLVLDDPESFGGMIQGFKGTAPDAAHSDVIDLVGINYNSGDFSDTYNSATGVLTVTDGTNSASLTFVDFTGTFLFASDGSGGTDIFDPPVKSSGASVSPDNDTFVFHSGMGAETVTSFHPKADTIELDHFVNIESVQQLASQITTDAQGDAVIALGHNDSITLPGVSANYLQAHLHSLVHLG